MSPWSFTVYLTYRISVSWSHVRSPVSIALANQSAVTSPIPGGRSRHPRGLMARMPGAQRAPADPCHQTSEGATPRPLTPSRSRSQGEAGRSRATPWSRGGVASPDTESRHPPRGLASRAWVRVPGDSRILRRGHRGFGPQRFWPPEVFIPICVSQVVSPQRFSFSYVFRQLCPPRGFAFHMCAEVLPFHMCVATCASHNLCFLYVLGDLDGTSYISVPLLGL